VAYDEELADRIRALIGPESGLDEKLMFGGLAFLVGGNMAVAASGQGGLMVRVDPTETQSLLDEPYAAPMVMRGREMNGWLRVDAAGLDDDAALESWVRRAVAYTRSLPPK
jgi:TfoX/Sxy family transcriptional regulator of competence genes